MFQVPSPQGKGGEEEQKTCLSPFHKGETQVGVTRAQISRVGQMNGFDGSDGSKKCVLICIIWHEISFL